MSEPENSPVLRRMLGTPANPLEQTEMSPAKAMQLAVSRGAEAEIGLMATVTDFQECKLGLDEIVDSVAAPHLIQRLIGPQDAIGLALWDAATVATLTEFMITGRLCTKLREPAVPTRTDAAVIADFLSQLMALFDQSIQEISHPPPVVGFRPDGMFEDGRGIAMAFDEIDFRQYDIRLRLGPENGSRDGALRLIMPWSQGRIVAPGAVNWAPIWRKNINGTTVQVEAVLHQITMPLDQLMQLGVGDMIPIPLDAMAHVALQGADQRGISVGRLGQCNGHRAVMLTFGTRPSGAAPCDFSVAKAVAGTSHAEDEVAQTGPKTAPEPTIEMVIQPGANNVAT